jgi:hypothetical protein
MISVSLGSPNASLTSAWVAFPFTKAEFIYSLLVLASFVLPESAAQPERKTLKPKIIIKLNCFNIL